MKVKATRSFFGQEGHVRRHQVIDVSRTRAKQLFANGLVGEDIEPDEKGSKDKDKTASKSGSK